MDLNQVQEQLEEYVSVEASGRQIRENEKAVQYGTWADSKAGKTFVQSIMSMKDTEEFKSLITHITEFMDRRKPGRGNLAIKLLKDTGLTPDVIAFLSTKGVFNYLCIWGNDQGQTGRSRLCLGLAEIIHDEWRINHFADDDRKRGLLAKLFRDFDRSGYPRHWRRRTIKHYFHSEKISWQGWTKREKALVGMAMVSIFKEATSLIEISACHSYVRPSEKLAAAVRHTISRQTASFCLFRPMVVPPRPWSQENNLFKGGYHTKKVAPYALIKGSTRKDVARLVDLDLTHVINAVNALQATPWRVNKQMLDALDWTYWNLSNRDDYQQQKIGKLPCCDPMPAPDGIPEGYITDPVIQKAFDLKCFRIRKHNQKTAGSRMSASMTLAIAKEFAEFNEIYMPHSLDSRGRAYPVPSFLHPQGPDHVKALLEFAHGEPIDTPEAAEWLAIAGANSYGNDKVSLQERSEWVNDNEEMILSIAKDYRSDLRWTRVSEPFAFLRFCFDWAGFKEQGYGFVSHMVCPADATCSGLQHYSALLRDEVGGFYVNLIPGNDRQDIYGKVANLVNERLITEADPDKQGWARDWMTFGVDRKMCKRQVMVVPYAGTFMSCLKYTTKYFREKLEEGHVSPWVYHTDSEDPDEKERIRVEHSARMVYMSKLIWEAISEVVIGAKDAMKWLSDIARDFSKVMNKDNDKPEYAKRMQWRTPDGFQVVHYREDEKMTRIETKLDGRFRISFYEGLGRLSSKDMATAIAPNFIHALDACHLRMTILRGLDIGITSFGMVHDSFGTHARHMPRFLRDCVKPAFVDLYQHDVLAQFGQCFDEICTVPPAPTKGSLDLDGVRRSEFFFS